MPPAPSSAPPAAAPPPAGVTIIQSGTPPKPPPPPTREIHLGARPDTGPTSIPPKPGTARERLSRNLRVKAGVETEPEAPTAPPEPETPPATPEAPKTSPETPPTSPEVPKTPTAPPDAAKTKINPWKMVDQWKGRAAELEKKLAEAAALPEAKQKEYLGRIEELQKHNERLEDEIRFVNYAKSAEFRTKYEQPYEQAWQRAVAELSEIVITDPNTNASRPATAQDLADLLFMPLSKAREVADQYFGNFADDIMAYRKELKGLMSSREAALKEAKEKGSARDKERQEMMQKQSEEMGGFIKQTWEKSVQEAMTHEKYGQYFTPVEGDQDGNQRLAKGFALVDRAYSETPNDPNLTPEQRTAIIRRHVAVRNRAAAFGRLVAQVEKLTAEKAALAEELKQFSSSTPPTGGGSDAGSNGQGGSTPASAHERIFGKLRSIAR